MNFSPSDWHQRFSEQITAAETLCFITRALEVQKQRHEDLSSFLQDVIAQKNCCVEEKQDACANFMLAIECMTRAILHELSMWMLLKQDKPDQAWDELTFAQTYLDRAMRAHTIGQCAKARIPWLSDVEKVVFPPQVFVSPGFVSSVQQCSICKSDYGQCDHIEGLPYMGEFCEIRQDEMEVVEVSFVDHPKDKRRRILEFSDNGGYRSKMTWRLRRVPDDGGLILC